MIILSPTLKQMLQDSRWSSRVATALLSKVYTTDNEINYLGYNNKMLTFLPKGKTHRELPDGSWDVSGRQSGKIGRVARRAIHPAYHDLFSDTDYEIFANQIKSLDITDIVEFAVIDGEAISYAYNGRNYDKNTGSLQTSCMRYEWCQDYFDVYKDHAEMLVMHRKDNKLIVGRALLWTFDDTTYMDRIYGPDWIIPAFRQHAALMKWPYRKHNTYMYPTVFIFPDGTERRVKLTLKAAKYYRYLPYMDTLKFYDITANTYTNMKMKNTTCFELIGTRGNDHRRQNGMYNQYYEEVIGAFLTTKEKKRAIEMFDNIVMPVAPQPRPPRPLNFNIAGPDYVRNNDVIQYDVIQHVRQPNWLREAVEATRDNNVFFVDRADEGGGWWDDDPTLDN